ncbi:MAG TPA: CHAD domain-containing protein [Gemmatimonadales bacterium]|nr:CHAD domain-containing protein [Gemmatimonadales bacterium]
MTDARAEVFNTGARVAAARIALARLDQADAAADRLADAIDPEALHDFRVAVRRLRSTLRNFRGELDDEIPKKLRTRLREVTRATTPARDDEVLSDWVKDLARTIPAGRRGGITWFRRRLGRRRKGAYAEIREKILPRFRKLDRRIRKSLTPLVEEQDAEIAQPTYGIVLATIISEHTTALRDELSTYNSPADDPAGHRARIVIKRLRYLLEPLEESDPAAAALIPRLKELQDALGAVHDLQILAGEIAVGVTDAASERAREQHERILDPETAEQSPRKGPRAATSGLLALARLIHETRQQRFDQFVAEWRTEKIPQLLHDCAALATALSGAATGSPAAPSPIPGDSPADDDLPQPSEPPARTDDTPAVT